VCQRMSRNELRGAPIWSGVCASVLLLVPGYGGTPYWRSKLIFRRCLLSNRREFLQLTLAASALPALAARNEPIGPARLAQNGPRVRVDNVIVESTSPMAIAFGNEATRFGLEVQGITDDVTDLWYQHLAVRWNRGSAVVAGLTLLDFVVLSGNAGQRPRHAPLVPRRSRCSCERAGATRSLRRPTAR
jgi:hypothetical protein